MDEDASLDDFLGDESSAQSAAAESAESADGAEATDAANPSDAVATDEPAADIDPATTTYAWSDEGAACDQCDEPVERRWQQDGGLVCIECKDWERA